MKRKCLHKWNVPDPQPLEAYCEECGVLYKGQAKGGKPAKSHSQNVLAEVAADLSGMTEPPTAKASPVKLPSEGNDNVVELVPPAAPPPGWCKFAGKNIADAYKLLIQGALLRFAKREAAEPEEEHMNQLGEALGEQLAIWFPDTEMTPATKIAIAAASVAATMAVGSRPIKPPARSVSSPKPTADVVHSDETPMANGHQPYTGENVKLPGGLF